MKKKKITFISIVFSSSLLLSGENSYIKNDSKVFLEPNEKIEIGKIDTATPVKVLSTKGEFREIKVTGWAGYGFENVLFRDVGESIFYLVLNDNKTKKPEIIGEKVNSFVTQWQKISYTLWVNRKSLTTKLDDIYKKGNELFINKCGSCHDYPEIKDYTSTQWPNIIKSMKPRVELSSQEEQFIIKYLQEQIKK